MFPFVFSPQRAAYCPSEPSLLANYRCSILSPELIYIHIYIHKYIKLSYGPFLKEHAILEIACEQVIIL